MCPPVRVPEVRDARRAEPPRSGDPSPPSHPRPDYRRHLTAGAAALVTVATLATLILVSGGGDPEKGPANGPANGPASSPGGTLAPAWLPWPAEGQASALVEGLGDRGGLGTSGAQTPVPIASVTKVMTAYVILRDHPLSADEPGPHITLDRTAANESVSGVESTVPVREGQRLSERKLLELMLIPSGNNIARLLARWDADSEGAFVKKMNQAARDLGMGRTTYTDASGLAPTTVSTSTDQLKLARQVMRDEVFRSIVAMPSTSVPGGPGTISNTNTLLGTSGVVGLKTGSSTPAGGALMWAATAPDATGRDRTILGVVLHQRAGTNPQEGLRAALDNSQELIEGVRRWLSKTEPGPR